MTNTEPIPQRLHPRQTDALLRPIQKARVKQNPQGFSHLEAWDVRAMLIKIFGFCGWSLVETAPTECVYERPTTVGKDQNPGVRVAYKAQLQIIIHLPDGDVRYAGSAIAEAVNREYNVGDAHDQAMKSAESGALKRAATNLGDQFGLSLYNDGAGLSVQTVLGFNDKATLDARADAHPPGASAAPSGASIPSEAPEDDRMFTDPK